MHMQARCHRQGKTGHHQQIGDRRLGFGANAAKKLRQAGGLGGDCGSDLQGKDEQAQGNAQGQPHQNLNHAGQQNACFRIGQRACCGGHDCSERQRQHQPQTLRHGLFAKSRQQRHRRPDAQKYQQSRPQHIGTHAAQLGQQGHHLSHAGTTPTIAGRASMPISS